MPAIETNQELLLKVWKESLVGVIYFASLQILPYILYIILFTKDISNATGWSYVTWLHKNVKACKTQLIFKWKQAWPGIKCPVCISYKSIVLLTLGEKCFWKTLFQVCVGPVKGTETRHEWENSRTLPYYKCMMARYFLASSTMHMQQ